MYKKKGAPNHRHLRMQSHCIPFVTTPSSTTPFPPCVMEQYSHPSEKKEDEEAIKKNETWLNSPSW